VTAFAELRCHICDPQLFDRWFAMIWLILPVTIEL